MFSGHLLGIITPVLMIHTFGYESIVETGVLSRRLFRLWLAMLYICIVLQSLIIVGLRNHYTADVVVSAYVSPLLWNWYNGVMHPKDVLLNDDDDDMDGDEDSRVRWETAQSSMDQPLLLDSRRQSQV